MNKHTREYLPGVVNGVAAIAVLFLSFFVELRFPGSKEIAKPAGIVIVFAGMALVAWATIYLKKAILGEVEPRLDVLLRGGPYRFVRHPVYLGMTIALAGVAVALRSPLGLAGTFVLFLPSEVYRGRQEDKALSARFKSEWTRYASGSGFILPFVGKKKIT